MGSTHDLPVVSSAEHLKHGDIAKEMDPDALRLAQMGESHEPHNVRNTDMKLFW